jgi:site-specific recombinase XerD
MLQGELAAYEKVGLWQRAVNPKTVYRYRGVLLQYQKALGDSDPTLESTRHFLARLREGGFKPATLRLYRAALAGFHAWRGETLVFPIRVPRHLPPYHSSELVNHMLDLARARPRDHLILRLMSDAGLRRGEVVALKVRNVDLAGGMLRLRGKGDKDRVVPLTGQLRELLEDFCRDKSPDQAVVGVKDKAVYETVKKYGALAGDPKLHPHDLRHAFATRLVEGNANIRAVQELLGHEDLATTAVYLGLAPKHLDQAIRTLEAQGRKSIEAAVKNEHTVRADDVERGGAGLEEVEVEVSIEPGKGLYLPIDLPASKVLIESIDVRPSDDGCDFQFSLFDREPDLYPGKQDVLFERKSTGQRIVYSPARLKLYHDRNKSNRLHCAIGVTSRHYRFDIEGQELRDYLEKPVSFTVTLLYKVTW